MCERTRRAKPTPVRVLSVRVLYSGSKAAPSLGGTSEDRGALSGVDALLRAREHYRMRSSLMPCTSCACHLRIDERQCRFCGAQVTPRGAGARAAAITILGLSAAAGTGFTACAVYGVACTGELEPTCRRAFLIDLCDSSPEACTRMPTTGGRLDYFDPGTSTLTIPVGQFGDATARLDRLELDLTPTSSPSMLSATVSVSADGTNIPCTESNTPLNGTNGESFSCSFPVGASVLSIIVSEKPGPTTELRAILTETVCTGPKEPRCG